MLRRRIARHGLRDRSSLPCSGRSRIARCSLSAVLSGLRPDLMSMKLNSTLISTQPAFRPCARRAWNSTTSFASICIPCNAPSTATWARLSLWDNQSALLLRDRLP